MHTVTTLFAGSKISTFRMFEFRKIHLRLKKNQDAPKPSERNYSKTMSFGTEIQDSRNLKSGHFRIWRKNPILLRAVLMGTKSCTKILNFSTRFSSVEDFVTGKNLVDGEILCLGIISEYLHMLFYAGEIQNSICRRLEMATYFSLTRGWGLQEQTKL